MMVRSKLQGTEESTPDTSCVKGCLWAHLSKCLQTCAVERSVLEAVQRHVQNQETEKAKGKQEKANSETCFDKFQIIPYM